MADMAKTWDEISEARQHWEETLPPGEYRQRLVDAVAGMAVGELGRAEYLTWLASDEEDADPAECLAFAEQAEADGGPTTIDPRATILHNLIRLGRTDEADQLFRALLRAPSRDDVTVDLRPALGEVMEKAGRLRDAHRAYTVGLKDLDPELDSPEDDSMDDIFCLLGRYKTRRMLGLGTDHFDQYAERAYPDAARSAAQGAP